MIIPNVIRHLADGETTSFQVKSASLYVLARVKLLKHPQMRFETHILSFRLRFHHFLKMEFNSQLQSRVDIY